ALDPAEVVEAGRLFRTLCSRLVSVELPIELAHLRSAIGARGETQGEAVGQCVRDQPVQTIERHACTLGQARTEPRVGEDGSSDDAHGYGRMTRSNRRRLADVESG